MAKKDDGNVLVFRNDIGQPVAVPGEIVTASERAYRCYRLRVEGLTWEQVAIKEGYPTGSACKAEVDRYTKEGAALVTERSQKEMLTLEITRMDALQSAVWTRAMGGNIPAATLAMNLIMNRAKLLNLINGEIVEERGPATLVVPNDAEGFLNSLKSLAGERSITPKEKSHDRKQFTP
jgi:hypothetical protein